MSFQSLRFGFMWTTHSKILSCAWIYVPLNNYLSVFLVYYMENEWLSYHKKNIGLGIALGVITIGFLVLRFVVFP